jgi:crotonobetainyl-CoA:carnitine CoA-transferase CaiB-like acyl-CoA transferase
VKTKDGAIILACGNDNLFNRLCQEAGANHLPKDPRFATNAARVTNRDALDEVLEPIMMKRTTAEWVEALEAAGVPCGPINNIKEVFENPQVQARGMKIEMQHKTAGKVSLIRGPMRFSETPVEHKLPPPTLGEHTDEVLSTLGMSPEEIAKLKSDGIV